ncbi:MAG: DUF1543 domain-containing protein [Mucilaginibacter sp.]
MNDTGPKLFMVLLGSKPAGRNVEQHDYFFGIASSLGELVPAMKAFWPEAGTGLHVDGWREIGQVDGYDIRVTLKAEGTNPAAKKLFFINLGGYQTGKLQEQHYTMLTVHEDRIPALKHATKTSFYKSDSIKGAPAHIDEKYGVDVDDIYRIEDILSPQYKEKYLISITPADQVIEDQIHLGYFKLNKIV